MSGKENQIILQQWFGELPDGSQVEKNSFQIFIEGPEVTARRGATIVRELIGFVGKKPGEPVNFLPVIHAFRDLLPMIRVQIAQGLIQWRKDELEKAKQLMSQAKAMGDDAGDAIVSQFADSARAAASDALRKAEENHAIEQQFARSSEAPDPDAITEFVRSITRPAEEADDIDADDQNL